MFSQMSTAWGKTMQNGQISGVSSLQGSLRKASPSSHRPHPRVDADTSHCTGGDAPDPQEQHSPFLYPFSSFTDSCIETKVSKSQTARLSPRKSPVPPPSSSINQRLPTRILPLPRSEFYCLLPPLLIINIDFTACVVIPAWRFIFLFCIARRRVVYSTSPFTPPRDNYLAPSANHRAYTILENNHQLSCGGVWVTLGADTGAEHPHHLRQALGLALPSTYFHHLPPFGLRPHPLKAKLCHRHQAPSAG